MTAVVLIVCVAALAAVAAACRTVIAVYGARNQVAIHERAIAEPIAALTRATAELGVAAEALRAHAGERGPSRVGHRVTVHTKQPDDQTLYGLVVGDYADRLVLEDAEYVTPGGSQPLPGRQDVATTDVAWVDVHASVAVPDRAPA